MFNRIKQMLIKEFLQMLRDPRMRAVIFGMPVIQMMIMAFALTTDVTNIRTALLDMDKTSASRKLISDFTAGGYFKISYNLNSMNEIAPLLDRADVRAIIHIPSGFAEDIASGKKAKVQMITDGTDNNSTAIVLGYANTIIGSYGNKVLIERLRNQGVTDIKRADNGKVSDTPLKIETLTRAWFNTNQESKYYYVPSLIAVMLFIFSLLLTSIGIVKEKEIGTIEQVMVTPIRRLEFILGKTVPYMITGYISMSIMLCVAFIVFGVHVKGSILLLYFLAGIYLCGNLGLALIISATSATQQQAMLTSFLILMPCVMLSGFMFPINNMPEVVQYATFLNPMRWFLHILRGIVMKDVGIVNLLPAITAQLILSVLFIITASIKFKKTIS
ncbi:MAG: ABC transporter permease [Desulfamplus sp.]|nr:ABC transporter permease [Desulfamplus sp.]